MDAGEERCAHTASKSGTPAATPRRPAAPARRHRRQARRRRNRAPGEAARGGWTPLGGAGCETAGVTARDGRRLPHRVWGVGQRRQRRRYPGGSPPPRRPRPAVAARFAARRAAPRDAAAGRHSFCATGVRVQSSPLGGGLRRIGERVADGRSSRRRQPTLWFAPAATPFRRRSYPPAPVRGAEERRPPSLVLCAAPRPPLVGGGDPPRAVPVRHPPRCTRVRTEALPYAL